MATAGVNLSLHSWVVKVRRSRVTGAEWSPTHVPTITEMEAKVNRWCAPGVLGVVRSGVESESDDPVHLSQPLP